MSDVLKLFKDESKINKYGLLIESVEKNSSAMINSLRLFELAARYETRKLLKMSDQEIAMEEAAIKDELVRLMFTIHIAEEVINNNKLQEEYKQMMEEVMSIVAERYQQKATAENAESKVITGDTIKTEGKAETT